MTLELAPTTAEDEDRIISPDKPDLSTDSSTESNRKLVRVIQGPEGVTRWYERSRFGNRRCESTFYEYGAKEKIQQCPSCGAFHNRHSPPLCFSCAVGLDK